MLTAVDFNSLVSAEAVTPSEPQSFFVHHIEYPQDGLSREELECLHQLVSDIKEAAAPQADSLEFAFPGNVNPDTWKATMQKHCYGWRWVTGLAFRQEKLRAPSTKPSPMQRYFSSLSRAFPEHSQKLQQAIKASETPRGDPVHHLTKTSGFETLFRNRRWVSPTEALLGTGGFCLFCVSNREAFFRHAAQITGQAGSMSTQGVSFLIPVLTRESFLTASQETLYSWFGLFELYLLEYQYSEGLLIASRRDLTPILDAFHSKDC